MTSQINHDLYLDIERECMPIIRSAASAFGRRLGIGTDDAIQEGRLALLLALKEYDYNASKGGIYSYARTAVKNAMCGLLYAASTKSRCPHVVVEEGGELRTVRSLPELMGDFNAQSDGAPDPEAHALDGEVAGKLRELKMQLYRRLNSRQKKVFNCLFQAPIRFNLFLRNRGRELDGDTDSQRLADVTHVLIAEYLGLDKNSVDWSVHQIKRHFATLAESKFSDIIQEAIQKGKWPMFHVSERANDVAFIQDIVKMKDLDARPLADPDVKIRTRDGVTCVRSVERYPWGSVIMLRYGERSATVVAEGRFNPISGEVLTEAGFWKPISEVLSWYPEANRFLNSKA